MVDSNYKPLSGLRDAINALRESGHRIVIHSCNNAKWIEKVLNEHDIKYDYINDTKKPNCDLFIDDKGYHFPYEGDWKAELPKIEARLEGLDNRKW